MRRRAAAGSGHRDRGDAAAVAQADRRGRRGVRVHRCQGRRRHDHGGRQRRRDAGRRRVRSARSSSTCIWRTATPRSSSASSRASRSSTPSTTSIASTRRSSRAWSCSPRPDPHLLASSDRAAGPDQQRAARAQPHRVRHRPLSLRRPRRAPVRRRGPRRARSGGTHRHRRQPGAGHGAQCEPHRRRLPSALRPASGSRVIVNRLDSHAEIDRDDVEKVIGSRVLQSVPSDYRMALRALNKGRPLALDNHNKLAGSFRELAHDLAGIAPTPSASVESGGLFGLLKGRRRLWLRTPPAPLGPVRPGRAPAADVRHPHYQTIKSKVHQELLNRLNLERLARMSRDQAEPEIRTLILGPARDRDQDHAAQPLRARVDDGRRPRRAVRPGAARGAAEGSDHLRHPGQPLQPRLRRARRTDRRVPVRCSATTST